MHLHRAHGCVLQGGGSDQWGNITAGIDLARRVDGAQLHGLVWPLLTTADGAKFGKSAGNAVCLDATFTSPYAYYQYWFNAADADVERFLRLFTFLQLAEVAAVVAGHAADPSARHGKRVLAREATRILHGDAGVASAERATEVLFGDEPYGQLGDDVLADAFGEAPSVELPRARLDEGIGLLELMTAVGASASNGEARRLVQQGAVRLNNAVVDDATPQPQPRREHEGDAAPQHDRGDHHAMAEAQPRQVQRFQQRIVLAGATGTQTPQRDQGRAQQAQQRGPAVVAPGEFAGAAQGGKR